MTTNQSDAGSRRPSRVRCTPQQGVSAVRDQGRSAAGQVRGEAHAAADELRQR
ncbi:hypothetical protein [Micromonospora orduensis]|uniref:hypothetical protein n=1 Tax=Micromonospora orduensis TaxID=1420891 RepID=UPI00142EFF6C|nr:hypothetical protein [Micromonospora orduensis]